MASVDINTGHIGTASLGAKLRAFYDLTKGRVAVLVLATTAAGFYLGSSSPFNIVLFLNAMIAITLLFFGVASLNQVIERDIDRFMDRTAWRPLPTRRLTVTEALIFGILHCTAAEIYLFVAVNALTAVLGLAVIVVYVLIYTPLKTRTTTATAVGAISGALPPLMGWTAAANEISMAAWALFALQTIWQFPHFFAIAYYLREQYRKGGIRMLPVIDASGRLTFRQILLFTIMLLPISLSPYFIGLSGKVFLMGASILGVWHLIESIRAALKRTDAAARRLFFVTITYLPLLYILMVADKN